MDARQAEALRFGALNVRLDVLLGYDLDLFVVIEPSISKIIVAVFVS